jgi:hypothetical protein
MDAKHILVAAVILGGLGGYAWSSLGSSGRTPAPAVEAKGPAIVLRESAVPDDDSVLAASDREWAARGEAIDAATPAPDARSVRAVEQSAYYSGCNEVRAAGKAPLYAGQPGYRPEMDGDGDGVACEPYRG